MLSNNLLSKVPVQVYLIHVHLMTLFFCNVNVYVVIISVSGLFC